MHTHVMLGMCASCFREEIDIGVVRSGHLVGDCVKSFTVLFDNMLVLLL